MAAPLLACVVTPTVDAVVDEDSPTKPSPPGLPPGCVVMAKPPSNGLLAAAVDVAVEANDTWPRDSVDAAAMYNKLLLIYN